MRLIVTTSVAPDEVLRFDVHPEPDPGSLLHRDLPRNIYVVHPDIYDRLVDHLGPLEAAGIAVDDLTNGERHEAARMFEHLERRIRNRELIPGRD